MAKNLLSPLLSVQGLSKSFGSRVLFQGLSFGLFVRDKVGLIGPNGSGKSTLLKILAGLEPPDEGSLIGSKSLKIGYVPQESEFPSLSIFEVMQRSAPKETLSSSSRDASIATILTKMGFEDPALSAQALSGGWKKRLSIACEWLSSPDLLLLDEPTNHLDLEGVLWLEKFLATAPFAYVVISHDRTFLENSTTRTMELDKSYPKGVFIVEGPYSEFIEKREIFLAGQKQQQSSLNSTVRRELDWLRQNPKARTTKSQARIQEAGRLIEELKSIKERNQTEKISLDFSSTERQSRKLLTATNIEKSMGGRLLFSHLDLILSPGTRLGIAGINGSGKTTLLRLLALELTPDKGTIKVADGVKMVYFDQHRQDINPQISLREALAPQGDSVLFRGQFIHVNSWAKRFLFSPERLDLPFGQLSGGEKARVHMARFMLQPADILLLDEPTNDLDIPTLEVLENSLLEFPGAIVLISHDRYLLDQVSTLILGLGSREAQFFADYRQWEESVEKEKQLERLSKVKERPKEAEKPPKRSPKMSYSEKREWEQIEGKIEALEKEIAQRELEMQDPRLLADAAQMQQCCQLLHNAQRLLDELYQRWQELELKS